MYDLCCFPFLSKFTNFSASYFINYSNSDELPTITGTGCHLDLCRGLRFSHFQERQGIYQENNKGFGGFIVLVSYHPHKYLA